MSELVRCQFCGWTGEGVDGGDCPSCPVICAHCKEPRRSHIRIREDGPMGLFGGKEHVICRTSVFKPVEPL